MAQTSVCALPSLTAHPSPPVISSAARNLSADFSSLRPLCLYGPLRKIFFSAFGFAFSFFTPTSDSLEFRRLSRAMP